MKKKSEMTNEGQSVRAVRVLENYGGASTNEQRILPGVYAENDTVLFGLAEYLVENKFAEWSDEPIPASQVDEQTPDETVETDDPSES